MTYEEALDKLDKTLIGDLELKVVLTKALKKQIPKKPLALPIAFKSTENVIIHSVMCNVCKCTFMRDKQIKYCPFCGQALDWSDT